MGDESTPAGPGTENGQAAPAIQTVQRAARILSSFTVARPQLSLNEITANLGTSKATAHRYTKALRESNLLRYDEREALYSLSPQVLAMSAAARAGMPVISIARPYMQRLVRELDETVVLSVWDGDSPVVVRVDDNTNRIIRVSIRTGSRLSRTGSAQGRVFCAFLPEEEVPGLAQDLKATPELRQELERIRQDKISANAPSVHGVRTIAAPVFRGSAPVATLAVVATTDAIPAGPGSPAADALVRITSEVSTALSRGEPGP